MTRYFRLAAEVATWSKDPSTQVGAVAVGDHGQILALGYNGFPRGINDDPDRLRERPKKYSLMVHAEMNLIYNASLTGISLAGAKVFSYGLPVCDQCVLGLIQSKVSEVYVRREDVRASLQWQEKWKNSKDLLDEAGISWYEI